MQKDYECTMDLSVDEMRSIFGQHDQYIKKIERDLQVDIIDRNGAIRIIGEEANAQKARSIIEQLMILKEH